MIEITLKLKIRRINILCYRRQAERESIAEGKEAVGEELEVALQETLNLQPKQRQARVI